jgi:transposase InsO family protein
VVDILSRYSPIIDADHAMNGAKVVSALERATKRHGYPEVIQVDNGSEFQSKALGTWAYVYQVNLDFIGPGKPYSRVSPHLQFSQGGHQYRVRAPSGRSVSPQDLRASSRW